MLLKLAEVLGHDVGSPEFEEQAMQLADLFLERGAGLQLVNLRGLERWRRKRGGKAVSL